MKRLNKTASQLAVEFGLRGGTDITGYSLLGHGMEMAEASGVSLKLNFAEIPFISGARKYAEMGSFPGGAFDNKKHFESKVQFADSIDEAESDVVVRSADKWRFVARCSTREPGCVPRTRAGNGSGRLGDWTRRNGNRHRSPIRSELSIVQYKERRKFHRTMSEIPINEFISKHINFFAGASASDALASSVKYLSMNIGLQILIIMAVILINAVFVLSEMSVASSRKARLQQRVNDGDQRANTALRSSKIPICFLPPFKSASRL